MLETRQLQLLQAVASSGSYSAAGRELGLTQPAVTYQMRNLERQVGTALTVRQGRFMRLTAAGEALVAHADRVLATLRAAEEEMGSFVGRDVGEVRIASFPSASATLVADAMAVAKALIPNVKITYVQAEPREARTLVRRGDADLAITYRFDQSRYFREDGPQDTSGSLRREPLFRDRMWVVLPKGHPAIDAEPLTVEHLRDETWNLASERYITFMRNVATEAGFDPQISYVADDYVSMQALVARRLGVALIPGLGLAAHRHPDIVPRLIEDWPNRGVAVEFWPDLMRVPSIATMLAVLSDAALRVKVPQL